MSLQAFNIEFDRPNAIYAPGEVVSGNVVINLLRQKVTREVKLSTKGEAHVKWSQQENETDSNGNTCSRTVYYTNKEVYFHVAYPILERSQADGMVHIPAGFNKYSFHIRIPSNIPCSFEHEHGYIRYTMKAIINRPWKFDHECKVAFTVISMYDLNIHREQCISLHDDVYKDFHSCFCCSDGSMNVQIKVPTTGFVPGQYIEAILDLTNNSNINVEKVSANLEQLLEFHAKGNCVKKDKLTVMGMQKLGPFNKHAMINVEIYVPPVPPSNLEFCNIIHLQYYLHIVIHVSGLHLNVSRKYSILIGTIPLRPNPFAPTFSSSPMTSTDFQSTSNNAIPLGLGAGPSAPLDTPSADYYFDAPPSYEECCTSKTHSIKEHDESEYVYGANTPFAPKYPVFNFPIPH